MPNLPRRWNKSSLIRVLTLKSLDNSIIFSIFASITVAAKSSSKIEVTEIKHHDGYDEVTFNDGSYGFFFEDGTYTTR